MENKINIAKLLEDCPKGMELDCTTWENVTLHSSINDTILIMRNDKVPAYGSLVVLNKYGRVTNHLDEKCRIFPKGKKTWEGFHRPFVEGDIVSTESGMYIGIIKSTEDSHHCCTFCSVHGKKELHTGKELLFSRFATTEEKQILFDIIKANDYKWDPETKTLEKLPKFKDGDIITCTNAVCTFTAIFKDKPTEKSFRHHCSIINDNTFTVGLKYADYINPRFATEAEKQRLFNAIKVNGYRWNSEKNTLEKLIKPIFKRGDKIRVKNKVDFRTINDVCDTFYTLIPTGKIYFTDQDNWELAPNKFDISTLIPFESKVLVRSSKGQCWTPAFFGRKCEDNGYITTFGWCQYCIPFEPNIYLMGTTQDCSNFYKTWE